jgi:DnaJ homolog subfamily B member 4
LTVLHANFHQKPHPLFTRDGDDIKATINISLKEALTGWDRTVQTIDGKQVSVRHSGPTPPLWKETFPNQGMPRRKSGERGDFIVGVNINFPLSLTAQQKAKLKDIL